MTHLLCPLCGKYSELSTLESNVLEPDFNAADFKGLGRGRGFVKGELYSIMGDNVYTPILAERIDGLYNVIVNRGILVRAINDSTNNLVKENNEMRNQLASKDSRIYSLDKEIKERDGEIEELELRSHVDYLMLESLSLDKSSKLRYDQDSYYMVLTPKTNTLNLFLLLIFKEIPTQLRRLLLSHVDSDNFPIMRNVLKNVPERRTIADDLMGDSHWRFKGLNYTGQDQYTLKLSELKNIVSGVKDTISTPDELKKWLRRSFNLDILGEHESHTDFMVRIIKEFDKRSKK
jgi:hypothetical protein